MLPQVCVGEGREFREKVEVEQKENKCSTECKAVRIEKI